VRWYYKNKITEVDGIKFRSLREADRYKELKIQMKVGAIRELQLQPRFELQPAFTKGKIRYASISYIADFSYIEGLMDSFIVEDVKGMETEVFKIKRRLFEHRYPDLTIRIVK